MLLVSCVTRETELVKQGEQLVYRIEAYRSRKGYVPNDLGDIDIIEREESTLHYKKLNESNYEIWFGTSLGESKTYYSAKKSWESHQQ
ncbi:hypothetical protein [Hymenobacter nivis]|uniref:hypothetical protein n=1 Tax=Hymenobacter nivis TaxID=1850093 RepID=UPI001126924A|nr:hypothetical protein [Hymenobacter nivis]